MQSSKEKKANKLAKITEISACKKFAFRLFYVGIDYNGFEKQANSPNTIEAHLFSALTKTMLIKDIQTA